MSFGQIPYVCKGWKVNFISIQAWPLPQLKYYFDERSENDSADIDDVQGIALHVGLFWACTMILLELY